MLTQKKLKQKLAYSPESGAFVWSVKPNQTTGKGDIAGGCDDDGYIVIGLNYKVYKAHRLAWLYCYGYMPEYDIDHIDRNPSNNRIKNLREVSQQCNRRNTGNPENNTSGVKGVCFHKSRQKWRPKIASFGKEYHLGYYSDFTEAVAHRLAAEQALNWSNCDSSSPAYKHMQKYLKGCK